MPPRRITRTTDPELHAMIDLSLERHRLDHELDVAVHRARRAGLSWEEIGQALDMTRQAAWERWHT
jgi:hypothetical protein